MSKRVKLTAAIAVGALAAAGAAYAAIPSSGGAIHACYKAGPNPPGALRVIDLEANASCANSEKPLSWSQQGPQGAKGDQGDPGPAGPQGEPGPAGDEVFFVAGGPNATMTLPAGSYVLEADVSGTSTHIGVGGSTVVCTLPRSGGIIEHRIGLVPQEPSEGSDSNARGAFSFHSAITTTGGTVELKCSAPSSDAEIRANLLATRVASLG
jgi:hypothetical protein